MEQYNADEWNELSIADHCQKMIELLTMHLNSEYSDMSLINQAVSGSDNKALRWFNQFKNDPQNKSLLARAVLCFGDISVDAGNTNYLDDWHPKYYLYEWDYIKTTESFSLYCNYVIRENPAGLSSVIQNNLKNRQLQSDAYRYVFVKYPEI